MEKKIVFLLNQGDAFPPEIILFLLQGKWKLEVLEQEEKEEEEEDCLTL